MTGDKLVRLVLRRGSLNSNCHGTPGVKPWDRKTLRSTWQIVALGRDSWLLSEGRTVIGRRLWIYRPDGSCINFDISLRFARCPYFPGERYGPQALTVTSKEGV